MFIHSCVWIISNVLLHRINKMLPCTHCHVECRLLWLSSRNDHMSNSNEDFWLWLKYTLKFLRERACTIYLPAVAPPDLLMFRKRPLTCCICVKDSVWSCSEHQLHTTVIVYLPIHVTSKDYICILTMHILNICITSVVRTGQAKMVSSSWRSTAVTSSISVPAMCLPRL